MLKRSNWIVLFLNLLLIVLIFFITSEGASFVHLINVMFYVSIGYIIFVLLLLTIRGGFYDGVMFGFRRYYHMTVKKDYLEEWKEKPLPSENINHTFYRIIKFQALVLMLIFISLLVIYYLL